MALVSKNFSDIITFTRASTATYFDSTGTLQTAAIDAPRFDYNPSTLAAQGLLIEEARTNLLLQSEDFATTWGTVTGTVTTNAATAPSGTMTADALVTNGVDVQVFQALTISSGATVTGSVFLKQNGLTAVEIVLLSNNNTTPYGRATFNVSTGVISVAASSANGGTNASAAITNVGNGWYRCSVTVTYPAVTAAGVRIVGAGASGSVYAWGAQLEAGAFPTSYIPTTTTALTRAADVASVNTLSPWFNASAGTFFIEAAIATVSSYRPIAQVDDGTTNNRIYYDCNSGPIRFVSTVSGVNQCLINLASASANTVFKVAGGYSLNDYAGSLNGAAVVTDTSATVPTVDRLRMMYDGVNQGVGYIRRITYYPRKLSSAELQAITA
jgi:hypothetical protein